MQYAELLKAFAVRCGVEGLVVDEGALTLEIDGMPVSVAEIPETDSVMLVGEVGEPPPEASGKFGELLLQANHLFKGTGGGTLGQNPDSKAYTLGRMLPLAVMDTESFGTAMEGFVNTLERWRKLLADFRPIEQEAEREGSDGGEGGESPFFGGNGFMQV